MYFESDLATFTSNIWPGVFLLQQRNNVAYFVHLCVQKATVPTVPFSGGRFWGGGRAALAWVWLSVNSPQHFCRKDLSSPLPKLSAFTFDMYSGCTNQHRLTHLFLSFLKDHKRNHGHLTSFEGQFNFIFFSSLLPWQQLICLCPSEVRKDEQTACPPSR